MKTVLIVEDMAVFREPIEAILQREGFRTICAANGAEGLAALSVETPDLVLLDLGMPVMDGLTMLRRMREVPRLASTPVIVLSVIADKARIVDAARAGIAGYMLKSQFSLQQLMDRIREQVEGTAEPAAGAGESSPSPGPVGAAGQDRAVGPAGDAIAALKALKPRLTRTEIYDRVQECDQLKALSPTVSQVLKLTGNARCPIEKVARAIAQDHAIALKILRLANSAVFTRGEPVDSVQKAVVRIGLERIRQAVLNIAVVERFASAKFDEELSTPQFWEHAIACGIISSELAHAVAPEQAEAAFTMGLLHDVGRVIYAEQLGDIYLEVLRTARTMQLPLEQVESRMLLLNHADVMDRVLHTWSFPKDLINPIVFHHLSPGNVRNVALHQVDETLRLNLANRLAHAMLLGSSGNDTIYPTGEVCQALRVGGDLIARIEACAREQTDDIKFAMLASGSGDVWPQRREQIRAKLPTQFRPLFVGMSPETDAYRIFCAQLADPADEPANIAVVHIAGPRERSAVSARLAEAEAAAGVGGLPAVVLSPAAKLSLEGAVASRRCVQLPTPIAVSRFVAAALMLLDAAPAKQAA